MFDSNLPVRTIPNINVAAPGFDPPAPAVYAGDPEVDRLRSINKVYKVYSPEWDLYLAAYEGGPEMANQRNLWKHQRENEDNYNDRAVRLHYMNYCEQMVDYFTNFIFTETIQREGGKSDAWYQEFVKDVNRKGDSIVEFMKDVSIDREIFGHLYILVDTPRVNIAQGQILTKQDEEDLNLRPYFVLIRPEEVLSWQTDDFDNFEYLKRKQIVEKVIAGELVCLEKYTEFYTDRTVITHVDVTKPSQPRLISSETLPNPWGFIPIEVCRYKRSKRYPFMGNSFLRDFAYNNRELMNYTSLIQEFLYRQCFNLLVKESDQGGLPIRSQIEGDLGSSNVLEFPKGATAPAYLSPPAAPAQFLQSECQRIVGEMFKRAAQETMNELMNGEKSSGFSQSQSFSKTVPFISHRAETLEATENRLMEMVMKMIGTKWDGKIKYKDRYELTNVTDAITQLTSTFRDLMLPSETFVKEEMKRLVAELDGKIQPEKMSKILSEIDEMDFKEWQDLQRQALVGKGSSPAEQQKSKQTGTIAEVAAESGAQVGATRKIRKSQNNKAA
jgi:hypothetical protein